jgi:hypothetical protein
MSAMTTPTLRPLSTPELLDRTFSLYRSRFPLFAGIMAIPSLLTLALGFVQISLAPGAMNPSLVESPQAAQIGAWLGWVLVSFAVGMVVWAGSTGATAIAVSSVHLDRPVSVSSALTGVLRSVPRLLALVVTVILGIWGMFMAGVVLFAVAGVAAGVAGALIGVVFMLLGAFFAIFLALSWALCVPIAVLEDKRVFSSLSRSSNLTRGSRGRVLLVGFIFVAVILVVQLILQAPISIAMLGYMTAGGQMTGMPAWLQVASVVVPVLSQCVTGPLLTIGLVLLYYDERVRKEAFDLELLMATVDRTPGAGDSAAGA